MRSDWWSQRDRRQLAERRRGASGVGISAESATGEIEEKRIRPLR